MRKIAIFASGSGSNAQNIIEYFADSRQVQVSHIFCDKKNAYVLERAKNIGIPTVVFTKKEFNNSSRIIDTLQNEGIDLIILAGFLLLIPQNILEAYPNKIINIHPALLPKYGGKGMYGMNVHKAVHEAKEKATGITIHFLNEKYDEGEIIFQAKCEIKENDTPETIAQKVHALEYEHFPRVIEEYLIS